MVAADEVAEGDGRNGAHPSSSQSVPSSFPLSPSFWDEAAQVASHTESCHVEDVSAPVSSVPTTKMKRIRSSSPLAQLANDMPKRPRGDNGTGTTLRYLPNRDDLLLSESSHAYLSGAEYAPNRFGDIGDYMRKKEIKVQTQNRDIALADPAAALLPQIFVGISFHINGNTQPPMEELRKMILQRGGEVRPVLRSKGMVNYIIAPMLTQMKFKQFQNYRVVREAWITESCAQGKLLDWTRWKLTVQGGWEEEGRRGMEGFLTQAPKASKATPKRASPAATTSASIKDEVEGVRPVSLDAPSSKPVGQSTAVEAPIYSEPLQSASHNAGSDTGSFAPMEPAIEPSIRANMPVPITPIRTDAAIPISPGQTGSPGPVSPKIHRPEGAFEYYSTKTSNDDAARMLKDQEWRLRNTAERGNEGGFIDGYYQNSRLHHLSTWKAELRVLVAAAQRQSEENSLKAPSTTGISPLSLSNAALPRFAPVQGTGIPNGDKVIFHVDFDCFFVSCGLATRPHLRGKPAVVCHSTGGRMEGSTSEIASASYEARAKGVRNGMSLGRARTLVGPELQTIPYEFETYKKFSLAFYTALMGYADELQAVSVDEALIDATGAVAARAGAPQEAEKADEEDAEGAGDAVEEGVETAQPPQPRKERDPAVEVAEQIRDEMRRETGCEVSIGISHNIMLAKLATRKAKPAGVYHLVPAEVPAFLAPLDIEDFPSVGGSIRSKIEEKFGTTIVGELEGYSRGNLRAVLGPKTGDMVWGYIRGADERRIEPHKERKSISAEMNYGIRFQTQGQAEICVTDLAAEVSKRMKNVGAKGRLLTLKLLKRHPDAPIEPPKTFNKTAPVLTKGGGSTDDAGILGTEAVKLLRVMKLDPVELRGVGIQITKLDPEKGEREVGQGVLKFAKGEIAKAEASAQGLDAASESRGDGNAIAGPSRLAAAPSSEAIDPEYLAALPEELQEEVKADHARTRARKAQARQADAAVASEPRPRPKAVPAVNKAPPRSTRNAAAHISKQLRPKVKTHLKAGQIADLALYSAWNKAGNEPRVDKGKAREERSASETSEVIDLTVSPQAPGRNGKRRRSVSTDRGSVGVGDEDGEDGTKIGLFFVRDLEILGIDPEVFGALPEDMQKEVVEEERRKARQRKMLHRPADTSRQRARERESDRRMGLGLGGSVRGTSRTASVSPSRVRGHSRGGTPAMPMASTRFGQRVVVKRVSRPALLNATSVPDVLLTIERWIESRGQNGPAERDSKKVLAYLIKLLDTGQGLGGVEVAVECLQRMRLVLEEKWGRASEGEREEEASKGAKDTRGGTAAEEWWDTWRRFKRAVSGVVEAQMGAGLRL